MVEVAGSGGGAVVDSGDEGLRDFGADFAEGGQHGVFRGVELSRPDVGVHLSLRQGAVVMMAVAVGEGFGECGGGGGHFRVPDEVEVAMAALKSSVLARHCVALPRQIFGECRRQKGSRW